LLERSDFVLIFKEYYSKVYVVTTQTQSLRDAVNHCDFVSEVKLVQLCSSSREDTISSREALEITKPKNINCIAEVTNYTASRNTNGR